MKKTVVVMLLAVMLCLNVNADELIGADSMTTTVFYSEPSRYCIVIPETINVGGGTFKITASEMDLREDERVEISFSGIEQDGGIQMFTNSGKWMLAKLHTTLGDVTSNTVMSTFYNGMKESNEEYYVTAEITEGAGDYWGTMQIDINLVRY